MIAVTRRSFWRCRSRGICFEKKDSGRFAPQFLSVLGLRPPLYKGSVTGGPFPDPPPPRQTFFPRPPTPTPCGPVWGSHPGSPPPARGGGGLENGPTRPAPPLPRRYKRQQSLNNKTLGGAVLKKGIGALGSRSRNCGACVARGQCTGTLAV